MPTPIYFITISMNFYSLLRVRVEEMDLKVYKSHGFTVCTIQKNDLRYVVYHLKI